MRDVVLALVFVSVFLGTLLALVVTLRDNHNQRR